MKVNKVSGKDSHVFQCLSDTVMFIVYIKIVNNL